MKSLLSTIDVFLTTIIHYFQSIKTQKILFLLVLLYAVTLRFWKIEYIPMADDADELAYVYAGQSLFDMGVPISWSSFDYKENTWKETEVDSSTVNRPTTETFVRPWFDHPLLLPVLTGGLSVAAGYHFPSIPPALLFRLPMLAFALGTLTFTYLIAKHFFGFWPALFTLALLGGSPGLIFIQRMVVGENAVTFFMLFAIYAYLKKWKWWLPLAAVILASQSKVVGLVVAPLISYGLVLENKWKQAIGFFVVAVGASVALLVAIGSTFAGSNYVEALQNQSFRLLGWANPAFLLASPGFQNYQFLDFSYYVILILGITGIAIYKHNSNKLLLGFILILMGLIWVTSSEQDFLGWYKIPLFITLAISSAAFLAAKNLQLPMTLMGITIVNNIALVRYPTDQFPETSELRIVVCILFVFIFASLLWIKKSAHQYLILGTLMVLYLLQSGYVVDKFFEAKCMDVSCTVPKITLVQSIKQLLQ